MSDDRTRSARSAACYGAAGVTGTGAAGGTRWPALAAFATAWLLPATTARRTEHVSLWRAYGVHLASVVLTVLLLVFVAAWRTSARFYLAPGLTFESVTTWIHRLAQQPGRFVLVVGGGFLIIETALVLCALLLTPWGARDERVRETVANSLRQTWLHTTHALPLVLLVGALIVFIDRARDSWLASRQQIMASVAAKHSSGTHEADAAYRAAMAEWSRSRPWCLAYSSETVGAACLAGFAWSLWALLRGVGARSSTPSAVRPPLCERCGYILTGVATEGRCPECGEPVADSLGPGSRPGTLWERRRDVGRWRAWWRCCVDPVRRPEWFGRQVRMTSSCADHRLFLVMRLPAFLVIGAAGVTAGYPTITGYPWPFGLPYLLWFVGPMGGGVFTVGMLLFVLLAAGVVGTAYRISDGRNVMVGTMRMAAYLSGYLAVWAAFAVVTGLAAGAIKESLGGLALALRADKESAAFYCWFPPNLAFALGYFMLLSRGTAGLRYANR